MTTTSISTSSDGIAIGGYDPVAYFADQQALRGKPEFTHDWSGATWHFATAANAEQFAETPDHYAPQFGGYCAFGASMGKHADASPESWRIIDGKLCLMKSGSVRALSKLFTGKITKAMSKSN